MSETKFYSPVPKRKSIFFVPPSVIPSLPTPLEDNHLFHSTKVKRATSLLGGRDNTLGYFYHRAHDWVFSKVTKTSLVKNGRKKKSIIWKKHNNRVENQQGNTYHNTYHGNMYLKVIIEKLWEMGSSSYLFQTTVMFSGFLSSSQVSLKGKASLPQTQTVRIDLYCSEISVSKPSTHAKHCTLHPQACCQRSCRLPAWQSPGV